MTNTCRVGGIEIGAGRPLAVIAGPCVLESESLGMEIGTRLRDTCRTLGLSYVFKASFDKANRSSIRSARGPGLDRGVSWLASIRERLGVPVTTDIHEAVQAEPVARAVDLLQIPAFLCRQTDLLVAAGESAARHGRGVNVKKGQFMSPGEMGGATRKLAEAGCPNVMLTERGTFFGYGRLVNDFLGLGDLMELPAPASTGSGALNSGATASTDGSAPVCFDCTHSTQLPGAGEQTGGRPDRAPLLARAATAAGVHALFIETHPNPKTALSDASTMLPLESVPGLLSVVAAIRRAMEAAS
jgi:2-dehydro-3-deoxyphosphooctonate aldolase (KDO 8-P synthase)